ncbi:hypothetical protein [Tsukamurella sp. 1534]|uniref:hypothetical protein n=1 Tax=Tsukamurella sp. 1534 TaxID=1151061 RepID=UPI000592EFB1|nr:hypothetical protein [Tsukamurella sp. 1534]
MRRSESIVEPAGAAPLRGLVLRRELLELLDGVTGAALLVLLGDGIVVVAALFGGSRMPDGAVTGPSSKHAVSARTRAATVTVDPAALRYTFAPCIRPG